MNDAAHYRRVIVVDVDRVAANVRAITELSGHKTLTVSITRRSNVRFLVNGAEILTRLGIDLVDSPGGAATETSLLDLLGAHPNTDVAVRLESHVFGLRDVAAGEGVSYGATYVAPSNRRVALAPIGFADGLDRKLSGKLRVNVDGVDLPVLGRIAMDSLSIDVTDLASVDLGSVVSVYGDTSAGGFGITEAATALGISPAEIVARLSERAEVEWR